MTAMLASTCGGIAMGGNHIPIAGWYLRSLSVALFGSFVGVSTRFCRTAASDKQKANANRTSLIVTMSEGNDEATAGRFRKIPVRQGVKLLLLKRPSHLQAELLNWRDA
jgi:hypothetical protein